MATVVKLDLARDLPKVRKQYSQVSDALSRCRCDYTAPCVVGAMVPAAKREILENLDLGNGGDTSIGYLIQKGAVAVPAGQRRDFTSLQRAFDRGERDNFERVLKRVENKYLAREGQSA